MRKIAVLSVGRSDIGIYETLLDLIHEDTSLNLDLLLTGSHFENSNKDIFNWVKFKNWNLVNGLEMLVSSDTPTGIGKSIGLGIIGLSQYFAINKPDILVVLGDRFEMIIGPIAASTYTIPVAHIHGGAVTEGAVDELYRHAITKMSHLHFVSCEEYANRVKKMGEEDWRVFNFGAPGLDRFLKYDKLSLDELSEKLKFELKEKFLLVTFHPVTLENSSIEYQITELIEALKYRKEKILITLPNNDLGNSLIHSKLEEFKKEFINNVCLVRQSGSELYINLMRNAIAMIGNSSSGIVEAASFKLPVVNIGNRQKGKLFPENVIQSEYDKNSISSKIDIALSNEFREKIANILNPYGDGTASSKILKVLKEINIDNNLIQKKFID